MDQIPRPSDIALVLLGLWVVSNLIGTLRQRGNTTNLKGPASQHWLFGIQKYLMNSKDQSLEYEKWADEYGSVYMIPTPLFGQKLILADPKGITHFYSRETFGYVQTELGHASLENFVGKGVLWAEGETHKRQRKALTPAFSNAAIRRLTPVFLDSAYKVKDAWDTLLDSSSNGECVIDVQEWMNRVSLDSIGIAGFSHNFQTLEGKKSAISEVFNAFGNIKPSPMQLATFILAGVFPSFARVLMGIPSARKTLVANFSDVTEVISRELLERSRKEKEMAVEASKGDHSIIGLLIKLENEKAELRMSEEEVMAQMKVLILAGYETTSISLTWALINLSKNPEIQSKLRDELLSHFSSGDPTYDQLSTGLPYLDAVVHETLRLHPALPETSRVAAADDIIPLGTPIKTADGQLVDRISIVKGQAIAIPMQTINKSKSIWGSDAHDFKPQRWLDEGGVPETVKVVQGYRHLLTFVDGPRTCLGKGFALAEFKAVLSTLVRNYTFELRDGPDMKFGMGRSVLPRPKVEGEDGFNIPLLVRRVE